MKTSNPLKNAKWLWPIPFEVPRNTYVQYRYDFQLNCIPQQAPFYITANQCYVLYLNGKYICRGPARGYQESWPCDEVDLHSHLVKGHNWISVIVYNGGTSTFQYIHHAAAGFLCAAEWDKIKIYSGSHWLERVSLAYSRNPVKMSYQLNYQESVDIQKDDQSWIFSAKVPKGNGWANPANCRPFGVMPWHSLEERGIPNLTNDLLVYEKTAYAGFGKCMKEWQNETNLFAPIYNEIKKNCNWRKAEPGKRTKAGLSFVLPKAGNGQYVAVSLDMGKPCIGSLTAEIQNACGNEMVDFFFTEGLLNNGCPVVGAELKSGCEIALAARLKLKPGKNYYEFFQMIGHRYVVAIARETKKPLKLKLAIRQAVYPLNIKGVFNSDNNTLNDIYRICVQTQRVCSLDSYVDTPWREQAQWWGDARVQAQNTFHLANDARLLKRGIRSIARQEVPNGLTFGHAPTMAHNCILPDFSIIWAITLWDYYFQTGDIELFKEQWPRIQRLMKYFTGEGIGKNGLLKFDERYWLFLDWTNIQKEGMPALLNIWYLYMLEKLIAMTGIAGMQNEKNKFLEMYDRQKKMIIRYYFNSDKGLFSDGLDKNEKSVNTYSIHTQTMAIIAGLKTEHHANMIAKRLLPYLKGRDIPGALPSSYWVNYVYEVMTSLGYASEVVEHIKTNWSSMIPWGGTWEMFPTNKPWPEGFGFVFGATSMTHAWAAHPIYHFVRTLGGITQVDAAWKRIRFAPALGHPDINKVKVAVPTPQGIIESSWEKVEDNCFKVTLNVPKNVKVDMTMANLASKIVRRTNSWNIRI